MPGDMISGWVEKACPVFGCSILRTEHRAVPTAVLQTNGCAMDLTKSITSFAPVIDKCYGIFYDVSRVSLYTG